jgi:hsp33 protein
MEERNEQKDLLISGTAADGFLRLIGAETTSVVDAARKIHCTSPTATAALGRVLTGAILMSKEMKNDTDRLTLQVKGRGAIGGIAAVSRISTKNGVAGELNGVFVKGYAENPHADLPLRETDGKLDVGGLVGKGFLSVIMDLGLKEPYTGSVPLLSGEIAEDLSYYYAVSKQVPAAVSLGVLIGQDLSVIKAGGFMLQLLPGAPKSLIEEIETRISGMPSVTTLLRAGATIENILEDITKGHHFAASDKIPCAYFCDCSRERMEEALCSIGKEELRKILEEDHGAELCCHFCNHKYNFTEKEIASLL